MRFDEYYKARKEIIKIVKDDLLGPVEEDEVIENDYPVSYYLLGKLYPKNIRLIEENGEFLTENEQDLTEENTLSFGISSYQSAMGVTFCIDHTVEEFTVSAEAAYYEKSEEENEENKRKSKKYWTRRKVRICEKIQVDSLKKKSPLKLEITSDLSMQIRVHNRKQKANITYITVAVVNNAVADSESYDTLSQYTYFQPKISVELSENNAFPEIVNYEYTARDMESQELELLYHDVGNYASGHGCAVKWLKQGDKVNRIETDIMPEYEVLQLKPSSTFQGEILAMKYLATAPKEQVKSGLQKLVKQYGEWIQMQRNMKASLEELHMESAEANIAKCKRACERLERAVALLDDERVFRCFQLANEAMLMQRTRARGVKNEYTITWYPFQLAFFLQEIESIVKPTCEDRNIVDLLWFPTGGGKTEAYLGIAAFTLIYRRFKAKDAGIEDNSVGVIMRYTLRLLSLQQFERASALICALEILRKREGLGETPFTIGLWAGKTMTPNNLDDAKEYIEKGKRSEISNPIQIKKCPWCGSKIDIMHYRVNKTDMRMEIHCPGDKCVFSEGLPIKLIDDDIYTNSPSFIVGTIDKFAQIAYKQEAGTILGQGRNFAPDLIIQDELHLISGPLGTITGIFEAAIEKICERDNIQPKVIASTATIRNASNQILGLYGREASQFPPQGISINDSFFADLSTRESRPSRQYVGLMASGTSKSMSFVRIAGSMLFATRYLIEQGYSDEVIDSFWTETVYFNNLKELGSALVRIVDSVQERFQYLREKKFVNKYQMSMETKRYDKYYELTSRNNSSELGEVLQNELTIKYKKDGTQVPYDYLVASNMISVGVDIARLGTMLVVGQPLKTSEYIQATSRVGRSTPGLVFIMYHPGKSRDCSHYEQFIQYHSTFYKFVEPTSVTPFSDRARDRALQALYVLLCRYLVPELRGNEGARNYNRSLEGLEEVREYIYNYVEKVDPDELRNVKEELAEIEKYWEDRAAHSDNLVYSDYMRGLDALYEKDYMEGKRFRMMNSMRNVEPSVNVVTEE